MPIYEYTCAACGHAFEHWHAAMNEPAPACPECGGVVRRRISAPAIRAGGARATGENENASGAGDKPTVFGRKELNASLAARGQKPKE